MTSLDKKPSLRFLKYGEKLKSSYFSQERLLEYHQNELTMDEAQVTEGYLAESLSLRRELEDLIQGQKFVQELKTIQVSQAMMAKVQATQPQPMALNLSQRLDLAQWSDGLRRSAMIVAGALAVVIIVMAVPWVELYEKWAKRQSTQLVLVETPRAKSELDLTTYEQQEKPEFADEKDESPTAAVPVPPEKLKEAAVAKSEPAVTVKPAPVVPAPKLPTTPSPSIPPTPTPSPQVVETVSGTAVTVAPVATIGYLYRSRLAISNLQDTEPKITEKIKELGGRKAGEVALGWKKTPQSAYYHFTMPENKLNELTQFLALYGQANIVKEKHPRVMAEGIIRLIIEIEEAKP